MEISLNEGESSFIRKIIYENEDFLVIVIENEGEPEAYVYQGVEKEEFNNLITAESIGKYYTENIKGEKQSAKSEDPESFL